jgi:hypothetical protein
MAHAGGRLQAQERLCEVAAILGINRRRKALYGGFFRKTETNVRTRRRASWEAALGGAH